MIKLIRTFLFLFILFISLSFQTSMTQIHLPLLKSIEKETQLQHNQTQQAIQNLNAMPLYFVENKGQVDESVKYHAKIQNANIYFTPKEIVYQFFHSKGEENIHKDEFILREKDRNEETIVDNMRVSFDGANEEVTVEGLEENKARFSYLRGNDPQKWVRGARTYKNVVYRELYPKIDLIVYGGRGKIKHEYRVRPGGDIKDIRVRYEGIEGIRINEKGQLEIETQEGVLIEDEPLSYQMVEGQRVEVETGYLIEKNGTLKFEVKGYDKGIELIIDPDLIYATFLGGSEADWPEGIAVDKYGCVYVTGMTFSSDFPTSYIAYDKSFNGGEWDVFISKLNSTGTDLKFSTYLGGSDEDYAQGIAVDELGQAYVAGQTLSTDFPVTPGAYDTIFDGSDDGFITKLTLTGWDIYYSTYLGGSESDSCSSIAVKGGFGEVYVTGFTSSDDFPTTPGAFDTEGFYINAFVTKLHYSGSFLEYSTYLEGDGIDYAYGIAVDKDGNAYVVGETDSENFPTTLGAYDTSLSAWDIFITKLNSEGSMLDYSTFLGGSSYEERPSIAIDKEGNAYVVGRAPSEDFPTTPGAYDTTYNGESDYFVTKLNSTGSGLEYSTFLGGSSYERYYSYVAVDGRGNAYVVGQTSSSDFPTTPGAYLTLGPAGGFMTKLSSTGSSLLYSTFLYSNAGGGIALDKSGNAYIEVMGLYTSPTTPGAYDESHNGKIDVYIFKLGTVQMPIYDSHDFDGNGTSDVSVWRPSNGKWYIRGIGTYSWGAPGDIPVNGDYNNDGITDIAVWRPSNGHWYIKGAAGSVWGTSGDIPVPGDYDGDGETDIAVWRPSNGRWYIKGMAGAYWGMYGDIPVPGDYNGDGTTDIAVWRPKNGKWYIKGMAGPYYGDIFDIPVPGDYNGDSITDIAVWGPSNGKWYIKGMGSYPWGFEGDIPVPGDYNGDGITDIAVWRPSDGRWYIKGLGGYVWGIATDMPLVR